jgi:hypothetical protein
LGVALVAGFTPHTASAEIDICRTDPVLALSNGSKLTLQSTIQTSRANVRRVVYNVTIPAGLRWTVSYPGGSDSVKEVVKVAAASSAGRYFASTKVVTSTRVSVTDTASLREASGTTVVSRSGMSGQSVLIRLVAS